MTEDGRLASLATGDEGRGELAVLATEDRRRIPELWEQIQELMTGNRRRLTEGGEMMAKNDVKLTCSICRKKKKKHELVFGAVICKICLEEFEIQRLEPLQRYGEITFESGGTFFKPFWVKARGEITEVGTDQVKAAFSKKGSEVIIGKRFLEDPIVEKTLAFITDNGGRVEIDGGNLDMEMSGGVLLSTRRAFPLREKGQWAFGILFSKLVEYYDNSDQ